MEKSYTDEQMALYKQRHYDDNLNTTSHKGVNSWGGAKDYFLEYSNDRVTRLDSFIKTLKIKSILDFGCGKGLAADTLGVSFPNIIVSKYDPVFEEFSSYPTSKYDLVLCFLVIHLADAENKKRIANELLKFSSRYIVITAVVEPHESDDDYVKLFPDCKVRVFKKWKMRLDVPSHRGNHCLTLILEKTN
jgi:hypothetical protein